MSWQYPLINYLARLVIAFVNGLVDCLIIRPTNSDIGKAGQAGPTILFFVSTFRYMYARIGAVYEIQVHAMVKHKNTKTHFSIIDHMISIPDFLYTGFLDTSWFIKMQVNCQTFIIVIVQCLYFGRTFNLNLSPNLVTQRKCLYVRYSDTT